MFDKKEVAEIILARLSENRKFLAESFSEISSGTATRYFVLDDLLPKELTVDTYKGFPSRDLYNLRDTFRERKLTFAKLDNLSSALPGIVTDSFHDPRLIKLVGEIVNMPDLEGDLSLYAGGLSRMDKTHFLNPHIDNSHDADRKRYRRLNLLFYVTPDLEEQDGGSFELWDQQVKKPCRIAAKFNRLVVMETNQTSWHSVVPIVSDKPRCCLSNYYFSEQSPTGQDYYHVTSFLGRPGQSGRRIYGRIDNFMRQKVANVLGISRGKGLNRFG
jgi:Rps23 Pro-64 3,4-dihydroxylase Tpa1-like proline 4-hydroxylase